MKYTSIGGLGVEYIVDVYRCDPVALKSRAALEQVFGRLIDDLELKPIAHAMWHVFPAPGGITGLCLLSESHLAIHTFPEAGLAIINLYCGRPRPAWDWDTHLGHMLGARHVEVRTVERGSYSPVREATHHPDLQPSNRH